MRSVICSRKHITNANSRRPAFSRSGRGVALFLSLVLLVSWTLTLSGCSGKKKKSVTLFACDTYVTLSCEGKDANRAINEASDLLMKMDAKLSRGNKDSEISKLNASSEKEPVTLSEDTYYLLSTAMKYSEKTAGRFDPTVAPLMDLWGFSTGYPHVPDSAQIQETVKNVDYRKVHLLSNRMAYVEPGVSVDLGGIGKGFIGDILMQKLRAFSLSEIILDLGGNICAWSSSSDLSIGVVSPLDTTKMCCTFTLSSSTVGTVITSGAYERFFEQDGVRYGHIMDTRNGFPSNTDMLSVTVIGADGTRGDAYSTALYALGSGEAKTLAMRDNIDCILCAENGTLWVSSSLKGKVHAQEGWTIEYFG